MVTGVRWNLGVVDCDGKEAAYWFLEHWKANHPDIPEGQPFPWVVASGGGGVHFWFRLPEDLLWLNTRFVWGEWDYLGGPNWTGGWVKGKNVEILGDEKLVIAPPSIHPYTGKRYRFLDDMGPGGEHDRYLYIPAIMPDWIINLPERQPPEDAQQPGVEVGPPERQSAPTSGDEYDREDVLAAITNKVALAMSWRVRFASSSANDAGWWMCHAVSQTVAGRSDDARPSASFHEETGVYMEMYDRKPVSLFDLGVKTGYYPNWRACLNDLGKRFNAVPYRLSGRGKIDPPLA